MTQPVLTLDESTHTYRVGGIARPGVNEILVGAGVLDTSFFTEQGAWYGTLRHQACQYDDEGDLDFDSLDKKEIKPYVRAWRKCKADIGWESTAIEEKVYNSTYGYAGRPDRIGSCRLFRNVVLDLKTGASSKLTRYQTVAYAGCLPNAGMYARMEARLKPNGLYSLKIYTPQDHRADWSRWLSILDVYNLRKELKLI